MSVYDDFEKAHNESEKRQHSQNRVLIAIKLLERWLDAGEESIHSAEHDIIYLSPDPHKIAGQSGLIQALADCGVFIASEADSLAMYI